MLLTEKEIRIPSNKTHTGLLEYFGKKVIEDLSKDEIPIRFVITQTDNDGYSCELGVLSGGENLKWSIFDFNKRKHEDVNQFNTVLLVPTGIGCEIGGHSGDAGPVSRLIASACDNLITHPNVVNASDINELPENGLYVEGSVITRLLMGTVALQPVRSGENRMKNNLNELPFLPRKLFIVDNYLEAVGVMHALKAGVALDTIRRPIEYTKVKLAESKAARPDDIVGHEDLLNNVLTQPAQKPEETQGSKIY